MYTVHLQLQECVVERLSTLYLSTPYRKAQLNEHFIYDTVKEDVVERTV